MCAIDWQFLFSSFCSVLFSLILVLALLLLHFAESCSVKGGGGGNQDFDCCCCCCCCGCLISFVGNFCAKEKNIAAIALDFFSKYLSDIASAKSPVLKFSDVVK